MERREKGGGKSERERKKGGGERAGKGGWDRRGAWLTSYLSPLYFSARARMRMECGWDVSNFGAVGGGEEEEEEEAGW